MVAPDGGEVRPSPSAAIVCEHRVRVTRGGDPKDAGQRQRIEKTINQTENKAARPEKETTGKFEINSRSITDGRGTPQVAPKAAPAPLQGMSAADQRSRLEARALSAPPRTAHDALLKIMTNQPQPQDLLIPEEQGDRGRAAAKIQCCWRLWSCPRIRVARYVPATEGATCRPPGTVRVPGFELSTREAAALHYLLENGRMGDLARSVQQLRDRGADISEKTILPMLTLLRRAADGTMAMALLTTAEEMGIPLSGQSYTETILAMEFSHDPEPAEAVAAKAAKQGFLLGTAVDPVLQKLGAQGRDHWNGRSDLQWAHQRKQQRLPAPVASPRGESPGGRPVRVLIIVITQQTPWGFLTLRHPEGGETLGGFGVAVADRWTSLRSRRAPAPIPRRQ